MEERMLNDCQDLKQVIHDHSPYSPAGFRLPFIILGSIALVVLDLILCIGFHDVPWWMDLLVGLISLYWLMTLGDAGRVFLAWKENSYIGHIACIEMTEKRDPGSLRVRFYRADQREPPVNGTNAPRLLFALGGWNVHSRIEHPGSPLATFPWKIVAFSFTGYETPWVLIQDERGNRVTFGLNDAFRALLRKQRDASLHFDGLLMQAHLPQLGINTSAVQRQDKPN